MRNLTRAVWILGAALLAGGVGAGCGGDDDDSSGEFSTGINPSTLLSDVTAEQKAAACEKVSTTFEANFSEEKVVRTICTILGAIGADTKADCETQRDACIDQAANGTGEAAGAADDIDPDCDGSADLSQCDGTVGELETCFNDRLDQISALLNSFSCDDAAEIDESALGELDGMEQPASCAAVQCAGDALFGEDDSDSN